MGLSRDDKLHNSLLNLRHGTLKAKWSFIEARLAHNGSRAITLR
jgi:hypothetical protein